MSFQSNYNNLLFIKCWINNIEQSKEILLLETNTSSKNKPLWIIYCSILTFWRPWFRPGYLTEHLHLLGNIDWLECSKESNSVKGLKNQTYEEFEDA